jgi:N-acetylglucosaminyldiphosphoundecaprenol N-acetyl-beta-D-mannosaminyltransferase
LDQVRPLPSYEADRLPFRLKRRPEERVELMGAVMDLVKPAEVFHYVRGRLAAGQKTIVANHNLHSLYLLRKDAELRAFFQKADLVEVDSIPLILWARLVGQRSRRFHRCTYLDWRDEFWTNAQAHGWRVFFVGGKPGVAEAAARKILAEWPGVTLETHHGYFDQAKGSAENAAVVDKIRRFAPQILIVGMGMPLQESWVHRNYDALPACAVFTVGGAFDYEAGAQTACPRWVGQLGVEWLFRLATNPKLFSRYAIEPWSLIPAAVADLARAARRGLARKDRSAAAQAYQRAKVDVEDRRRVA